MKRRFNRWTIGVLFLLLILPGSTWAQTEDALPFQIVLSGMTAPKTCDQNGWTIHYDQRTTSYPNDWVVNDLTRYYEQYVNGDLNLLSYAWNGYSEYADTYLVYPGEDADAWRGITASYDVPLWTDSYHAVNVEYVLYKRQILWEIRTELDCEAGKVSDYTVTSQAADGSGDDLPKSYKNLVVALEDIPRYGNLFTHTDYLGTIKACQSFYISDIVQPRASLEVLATDSLTHQPMTLFDGRKWLPIVDVAENYGQPGGEPILDQCKGK